MASTQSMPPPPAKLLGQRIMVGFPGTSASASLLRSVRGGQVGSVILFAANIASRRQTLALIGALQTAARQGGNPPLLIAVDQEGGEVKRLPNGPPDLSPPQMAATHNVATATREGQETGSYLKSWGINMDLAPVSDVPTFGGAFIWRQGRAFSFNAGTVANFATAFALGLQSRGVAATAKHFPGLGSAGTDTDFERQELRPTKAQFNAALQPYERMIPRGLDTVMLTVAGYPDYDPSGASAALSKPIISRLLRGQLKFGGVAITDALGTTTGHDEKTAGVLAAEAGSDILLYTDSAPGELDALETALRNGHIGRAAAAASYQRIVALKQKVAGR
jgi:beta-N-acetylhexosaminidase